MTRRHQKRRYSGRTTAVLLPLSLLLAGSPAPQAEVTPDGPGLPKRFGTSSRLDRPLSVIDRRIGAPRAHGTVAMHRGYLAVVVSEDGTSRGGFAFYDISDPSAPRLVARRDDEMTETLREPHAFGFSRHEGRDLVALQSARGVEIWDWTDVLDTRRIGGIRLPGVTDSAYGAGAWWVSWQAPWIYVGAGTAGLFVIDAADPRQPALAAHLTTDHTGGFQIGPVHVVGNLLVAANSNGRGFCTLDIGNPVEPSLIDRVVDGPDAYSTMLNGGRLYTAGQDGFFYRHRLDARWRLRPDGAVLVGGRGGYVAIQDDTAFAGFGTAVHQFDVGRGRPMRRIRSFSTGIPDRDEDFAFVLGPLLWAGNDHGQGSGLFAHRRSADREPPAVNMVNPAPGARRQPLTTRVGLTFTDQIDHRSLHDGSVILRVKGGGRVPGRIGVQQGIVNFSPERPLLPATTYEVVLPAGGVRDPAGNALRHTFVSHFRTAGDAARLLVTLARSAPAEVGRPVQFRATVQGGRASSVRWDFGDGEVHQPAAGELTAIHAYETPGHYSVQVTVEAGEDQAADGLLQTVHLPLAPAPPAAASPLAFDATSQTLWVVNPDAGTAAAVDTRRYTRLWETPVGTNPQSLAAAGGRIWVTADEPASLVALESGTGRLLDRIPLPHAGAPRGVVASPSGRELYVTLESLGAVAVVDLRGRSVTALVDVGPSPRGIARNPGGDLLLVSRFISPQDRGEIVALSTHPPQVLRRIPLEPDPGPDTESSGRGVPNLLAAVVIDPSGTFAWTVGKKDNTSRGLARDGRLLTFESTVRVIAAAVRLETLAEIGSLRQDLNDRAVPAAAAFSPLGDYLFVALRGSDAVEIRRAWDGSPAGSLEATGHAPGGLAVDGPGNRLFVLNELSRDVAAYDLTRLLAGEGGEPPLLARVRTLATEPLTQQVLRGKRLFNLAADPRLSRDGYLSCGACHPDGGSDGRVWDFTQRGEGLRNTISLHGRRGMGHGPVHWTGNFDEIQDFEHDIRGEFGGTGLMDDALFRAGGRDHPLGAPKSGLSGDLDALAAYVTSLDRVPGSPWRPPTAGLTPTAAAGREVYRRLGCASCHAGNDYTDSPTLSLHDVGTLRRTSGARLGEPLTGLDTPTLKGIWATSPYFHDGSAPDLREALTRLEIQGRHGDTRSLSEAELQSLIRYLLELDDGEGHPAAARRARTPRHPPPAGRAVGSRSEGTMEGVLPALAADHPPPDANPAGSAGYRALLRHPARRRARRRRDLHSDGAGLESTRHGSIPARTSRAREEVQVAPRDPPRHGRIRLARSSPRDDLPGRR